MPTLVADKVASFFAQYPQRHYPKGQIIIFGGEDPEHIYYLVSGQVRKYDVSYRGDEVIVNIFKTGAFFPMSWAINRMPNRYFYKTELDTELHVAPTDEALAFMRDNPDVMYDLLARLYRGMDGLFGRIVHLMSGTARSRLVYELIIECRRFGVPQTDGSLRLTANEQDLAARSGLSRETVSREMGKLKHDRLVAVDTTGITIADLQHLETSLGTAV
jgi:CRP-like cAMP-binding protein